MLTNDLLAICSCSSFSISIEWNLPLNIEKGNTTHEKIFDEKPSSTEVFATAVPAGLIAPQ